MPHAAEFQGTEIMNVVIHKRIGGSLYWEATLLHPNSECYGTFFANSRKELIDILATIP